MQVEILTPNKVLYIGEANLVEFPGEAGRFQVLDHHAPLMASLNKGEIRVKKDGESDQFYKIRSGYAEVKDNKVIVLVSELTES